MNAEAVLAAADDGNWKAEAPSRGKRYGAQGLPDRAPADERCGCGHDRKTHSAWQPNYCMLCGCSRFNTRKSDTDRH